MIAQSTDRLLRMREITERFGISESTVRRATASGALPTYRTQDNHRRVSESDLRAFLLRGQGEGMGQKEDAQGVIRVGAIIRVSSAKQATAQGSAEQSSLENQRDRVQTFIDQRFAGQAVSVRWYVGKAQSGLNYSAPHILSLLDDLLAGQYRNGYVVAQSPDRVLRFGSALIERIAKHGGAELLYAMENASDDDLVTDVLNVITHFTAKNSGRRGGAVIRRTLPPATLEHAFKLMREGVTLLGVFKTLKREGLLIDEKGRSISYRSLQRRIWEAKPLLDKTLGHLPKKNSFARFIRAKLRRSDGTTIKRTALHAASQSYCRSEGLTVVGPILIQQTWKQAGLTITRTGGTTRYEGMTFAE